MKSIPPYNSIENIMKFSNTQGSVSDLFFECAFIDIHKPKHIVEMGACFGGWAIYLNKCLENSPAFFTLIETFEGSEWNRKNTTEENKKILRDILHEKKMSIPYEIITDNSLESIKTNYDVFRYDGYSDYSVFKQYIDHADNTSLIFIHDYSFNLEIAPIFYSIKYSSESELYPIWFGKMSSLWTKDKNYKNHMLNEILKIYDLNSLKNTWTKTSFRPNYDWKFTENNFLDFNNTLVTR